MDILIGYVFITVTVFMLTWGLLKIVEKVAQIEYHMEHMKRQLEEYDNKEKEKAKEAA